LKEFVQEKLGISINSNFVELSDTKLLMVKHPCLCVSITINALKILILQGVIISKN